MKAFARLILPIVIALTFLWIARGQEPECCGAGSKKLSRSQTTSLVQTTKPILVPCCGHGLRLNGTVSLRIVVDRDGVPTCISVISGHPLMFGVVIESVKHWKFRPFTIRGVKKRFCGQIEIKFEATDYAVKYKLV